MPPGGSARTYSDSRRNSRTSGDVLNECVNNARRCETNRGATRFRTTGDSNPAGLMGTKGIQVLNRWVHSGFFRLPALRGFDAATDTWSDSAGKDAPPPMTWPLLQADDATARLFELHFAMRTNFGSNALLLAAETQDRSPVPHPSRHVTCGHTADHRFSPGHPARKAELPRSPGHQARKAEHRSMQSGATGAQGGRPMQSGLPSAQGGGADSGDTIAGCT